MKLKNTLALSLAAVMAAGLTACGSSADTASAASPAADSTAAESTEAAADTTAAPDGDGDPPHSDRCHGVRLRPLNWTQNDDANGAVEIRGSSDYAYGYDVMMAKKIGEALGQKVQIVKLDWDSLIPASHEAATWTASLPVSPSQRARAAQVDFSDPYYYASIVTLTKKDSAMPMLQAWLTWPVPPPRASWAPSGMIPACRRSRTPTSCPRRETAPPCWYP